MENHVTLVTILCFPSPDTQSKDPLHPETFHLAPGPVQVVHLCPCPDVGARCSEAELNAHLTSSQNVVISPSMF